MPRSSYAGAARRALLVRGMVAIGKRMPVPARPFYAAWLRRYVMTLGAGTLAYVCESIGVGELPGLAARFAVYGDAMAWGDEAMGRAIADELMAAGVWDDAMRGLDGILDYLRLSAVRYPGHGRPLGGPHA